MTLTSWGKRLKLKLETKLPGRELGGSIAHGIRTKKHELMVQKHTAQSNVPILVLQVLQVE